MPIFAAEPVEKSPELELRLLFLAWLTLALSVGLLLLAIRGWRGSTADSLCPPQRRRTVPWTFVEAGLCFVLYLFCSALFGTILVTKPLNEMTLTEKAELGARASLLALPLQVTLLLLLLRWSSGARLYQIGLHLQRFRPNLELGFLCWLVLTPAVYFIYWLYLTLTGEGAGMHPLQELVRQRTSPADWLLITASAVVAAPLIEEMLFRGVIQNWMLRAPLVQILGIMVLALILTTPAAEDFLKSIQRWIRPGVFIAIAGASCFAFVPLVRPWLPDRAAARGIYLSSLLFAAVHHSVWPSPVPLLFLGLGLGILAYRTQSLVGPILVHSLFNAVPMLALLIQAYEENPHGLF
jgi:membrane protease YdiL (CAAX protease family)